VTEGYDPYVQARLRRWLLATVFACGLAPAAALAAPSPTSRLASIEAAARTQHSVHYVTSGDYGPAVITFVGDAGISNGSQHITFKKGGKTGHVNVLVLANTAYVRGDAFTLHNFMGFKPGAAATYSGRWIQIPHSAAAYGPIAAGVTLASTLDELTVAGKLSTVADRTLDGQHVFGIRGVRTVSGSTVVETLYARTSGSPLPVEEIASRGTMHYKATFGNWNRPVHVTAPKGAVPIAIVLATA
jgi:hypothetical protein